ncbi:hypothetical protein H2198_004776 [Neophaeococcomyces mojaviensis]|uniref:Uncharacterized protein n=1 Tax=Neophaeococcomyces mojaviensis TaxID=3383035 RepID=A0ACC3A7H7_9EURO|nr:hypothetical protein H2198_004776 [Knufia sp. JES_112]
MAESVSGDATTGIYEPLKPPFQALNDTNQGPLAMVVSIPLIIIASIVVLVKLWTVYGTTRRLGINDATAIAAMALGIAYTIALNQSIQHGLGRVADELDESMIEALSKDYFAANILLYPALVCAKATVILLIITIKPQRRVLLASQALLGVSIIWGLASVIAISLQCSPSRWVMGPNASNTCVSQRAMQITIRSIDALIDVAIVLLPIFMMQSVQTSFSKKLWVVALFATRMITPIMTLVSVATLSDFYDALTEDRPFHAITPLIWTSVALCLSIITACIPSIKRFLADWASGLSRAAINDSFEMDHTIGMSGSRNNGSVAWKQRLTKSAQRSAGTSSDSVKGLVDGVIVQTKGYHVEYEEEQVSVDGNRSTSSGREVVPNNASGTRVNT